MHFMTLVQDYLVRVFVSFKSPQHPNIPETDKVSITERLAENGVLYRARYRLGHGCMHDPGPRTTGTSQRTTHLLPDDWAS